MNRLRKKIEQLRQHGYNKILILTNAKDLEKFRDKAADKDCGRIWLN